MTNVIALWKWRNNYEGYVNNTDNPYTEEVFNEMLDLITDEGRPDFRLGRDITGCFNEMAYTSAAMEIMLKRMDISKTQLRDKVDSMRRVSPDVVIKPKSGENIVTTTSSTSTTLPMVTTTIEGATKTTLIQCPEGVSSTTKNPCVTYIGG
jgi:hypothetical protein